MLKLFRGRESTGEFLPKLLLSKLEGPRKGGDGETLRPSHLAGSFSALGNSTQWLGFQGPWRQFVTSGDLSVYVVDNAKLVAGAKGSVWGWGVCVCAFWLEPRMRGAHTEPHEGSGILLSRRCFCSPAAPKVEQSLGCVPVGATCSVAAAVGAD